MIYYLDFLIFRFSRGVVLFRDGREMLGIVEVLVGFSIVSRVVLSGIV